MEFWPAVALFLMLILIADCMNGAHSRDFTVQDIVFLYPSTTPYPGGFKCFTCEKAPDNYECNRWAPDIYCPRETKYCYSQHIMDASGESLSVTKRCSPLAHCLNTGCRDSTNNQRVCTSCCEGNICNLALPRNETNAIFSTTSPLNSSQRLHLHSVALLACLYLSWLFGT
ncbi:hypothetical protein GDO86_019719 [Hymenochirus boettgeri]|uniref:Ly6/PLAUR domain-containing protein 6 n=1 Tax=Hymenochirus boettgeri TaxID=247094 RepID=A0A8T2ID64_9PIPI|nr:hypothetical protein GDO86_019719 [Hymenochirus boettgeri]